MSTWRPAHTAFLAICGASAFAYGLVFWLIARAFIPLDEASEETTLKTTARGWRLACRVLVVAATLGFVMFGHPWFYGSPVNTVIQHICSSRAVQDCCEVVVGVVCSVAYRAGGHIETRKAPQ